VQSGLILALAITLTSPALPTENWSNTWPRCSVPCRRTGTGCDAGNFRQVKLSWQ